MTTLSKIRDEGLYIDLEKVKEQDKTLIKEVQQSLKNAGFYEGAIDGIAIANGSPTKSQTLQGLALFKKSRFLTYPYIIGKDTVKELLIWKEKTPTTGDNQSGWHRPTNGIGWISSPFGPRWGRMHNGVDIAADTGTPVVAAKSGSVISVISGCAVGNYACGGGYGNYIEIDHGDGRYSIYAHLHLVAVNQGQKVTAGENIGEVGTTGHSTGPHLHFGIKSGDFWLNPQTLFRVT